MSKGKIIIVALVALAVGFAGGFGLRPVIAPTRYNSVASAARPAATLPREARSIQYFQANIDEARQVVAACRAGSLRGNECANAEEAIIKVDTAERCKRFLAN